MGWARTLLLGDIGNRLDIADTERDIAATKRELDGLHSEIHRSRAADASQDEVIRSMQREIDQLELCVTILLRLLRSRGTITTADLERLVDLIDD